jgi:hypothetical protein
MRFVYVCGLYTGSASLTGGTYAPETGSFYFTDYDNDVIWMSTNLYSGLSILSGLPGISGRVDGPVSNARFKNPDQIVGWVDSEGGRVLFITDRGNNVIRAINESTRQVSITAVLSFAVDSCEYSTDFADIRACGTSQ